MSINLYGLLKPVLGLLGLVLWPPECIQESWPSRRRTIEWRFGWLYSSPSPWEDDTPWTTVKRRCACSLISCPHPKYLVLPYTLRKFQATPDLIWGSLETGMTINGNTPIYYYYLGKLAIVSHGFKPFAGIYCEARSNNGQRTASSAETQCGSIWFRWSCCRWWVLSPSWKML